MIGRKERKFLLWAARGLRVHVSTDLLQHSQVSFHALSLKKRVLRHEQKTQSERMRASVSEKELHTIRG